VLNKLFSVLVFSGLAVSLLNADTINDTYPGLASSTLTYAQDANLPAGVLLKSGTVQISNNDLQKDMNNVPDNIKGQLKKNGFFHLERYATKILLLGLAKQDANSASGQKDEEIISKYLSKATNNIQVTDAEITKFYEENKDMCGGATLTQVKDQLRDYVLQQKQQEAVGAFIKTLGKRIPIHISAAWLKEQAVQAKDNPVDKARSSGLASLVDFGASGCRPCDMMTPVLANLKKKFEGKLNVLFVHVRDEPILASRYGIESIPVQVIYDKNGKEIYRHTGFFPQADIEKQLEVVGVK